MSEPDWNRYLADQDCYGERTKKNEHVAKRKSDDKRVSNYNIHHSGRSKPEVWDIYKKNFDKALARMDADERALAALEAVEEEGKSNSFKDSNWYKEKEQYLLDAALSEEDGQ